MAAPYPFCAGSIVSNAFDLLILPALEAALVADFAVNIALVWQRVRCALQ